jgi:peptidyl-prolyl cis-trans isomerase SurA
MARAADKRELLAPPSANARISESLRHGVRIVRSVISFLAFTAPTLALILGCADSSTVSSDVVARVNGVDLTTVALDKIVTARLATVDPKPSDEELEDLRLQLLSEMIGNEILMQLAASDQLTASDAEIDVEYNDFKNQYSEERFQEVLTEQQMTVEDLREQLRISLTIDKLLNKEITSKISVSEADIEAFYEANREGFDLPMSYHLAHILVTPVTDPDLNNLEGDDATTQPEALEKANRLLRDIQGGLDFATVARQYSEDPSSAPVGGDLNFQPIEAIAGVDPAIAEAMLQMRVGETFPRVVQTRFGYHLLKLFEIDEGGQKDLSDPRVEAQIRQILFNQQDQTLRAAYYEVIRNRARVENFLAQRILDRDQPS